MTRSCFLLPEIWKILLPMLMIIATHTLDGGMVNVSASIDGDTAYANQPMTGTVTITHDKNDAVDLNSFRVGEQSLPVTLVREVQIDPSKPLIISIYSFQWPAQPAGLYPLPSISMQVGGDEYRSPMTSYAVQESQGATPPTQSQPATVAPQPQAVSATPYRQESAVLRLQARVDGSTSLYPGQQTTFVYRYLYRGDIALTTESLPLLDAKGMTKVGEKEITNSSEGDLSVMTIAQKVEAVAPGTFVFGPSVVEGAVKGSNEKLSSVAPPITINVLPFPIKEKPPSFNGAVGDYTIKAELKSANQVAVGEELTLAIEISGKGNIGHIPLPEVCCQPGFSGFFKLSDLPPEESIQGDTQVALFHLRPLSDTIKEIPSIEFSFFNPSTMSYTTLHTDSIPITIAAASSYPLSTMQQGQRNRPDESPLHVKTTPAPIEVETILPLSYRDLYNQVGGTWLMLVLIPIGIAFLIFQLFLRKELTMRQKEIKVIGCRQLWKLAMQKKTGTSDYFEGIVLALKQALVEKGEMVDVDIKTEELPKSENGEEVKALIRKIEELRFGGVSKVDYKALQLECQKLIERIATGDRSGGVS